MIDPKLIDAACQAEEENNLDELEAFAAGVKNDYYVSCFKKGDSSVHRDMNVRAISQFEAVTLLAAMNVDIGPLTKTHDNGHSPWSDKTETCARYESSQYEYRVVRTS